MNYKPFFQKRLPMLGAFLLLSFSSFAQKKHLNKGAIFTNANDTIQGQMVYKNWDKAPESIEFNDKTYHLSELAGFQVYRNDGALEVYKKITVELDSSKQDLENLSYSPKPTYRTTITFARLLLDGYISLYSLKTAEGRLRYIVQKQGDEIRELINRQYYKNTDKGKKLALSELFIGQMTALTADCKNNWSQKLRNLNYKEKALVAILQQYHDCIGQSMKYTYIREKPILNIHPVIGLNSSKLRFNGDAPFNLQDRNLPSKINYSFGLGLDAFIPRTNKRLSIYTELLYQSLKTSTDFENVQSDSVYQKYNIDFDLSYLRVNAMARYHFLHKSKADFFLQVGTSSAFALKKKQNLNTEVRFFSSLENLTRPLLASFRPHEQTILAGLGCNYKNIGIEARVERGNGISTTLLFNSNITSYYILFSYRLKT